MEPVSLAASCLTLAGCATSLIKDLYDLRAKFKQVDRVAGLLCVQVSTLRTAIYGLSSWLERKPVSAACDSRLRNEFQQSLDACASLIMMLQAHVSHVRDSDGVITTRGKIRHILDESELKEYDRMLGVQVQALGFLVQVIQLDSMDERRRRLSESSNKKMLAKAKDDASTYTHRTSASLLTSSDSLNTFDSVGTDFDFDQELIYSKPYLSTFKAMMKRELNLKKTKKHRSPRHSFEPPRTHQSQRASATYLRGRAASDQKDTDDLHWTSTGPPSYNKIHQASLFSEFQARNGSTVCLGLPLNRPPSASTLSSIPASEAGDRIPTRQSEGLANGEKQEIFPRIEEYGTKSVVEENNIPGILPLHSHHSVQTVEELVSDNEGTALEDHAGKMPIHHAIEAAGLEETTPFANDEKDQSLSLPEINQSCFTRQMKDVSARRVDSCDSEMPLTLTTMENSIARQETALHEACERANTGTVKNILACGTEVNVINRRGNTPLYTACRRSESLPIVQILIEHGADISIGNKIHKTPLHRAAHFGHSQLVRELLNNGADVDIQDINGRSALHYACDSSWTTREEVIRLLLSAGADINILDSWGCTPLDEACEAAVEETIDLLLVNGALVRSSSYERLRKCQHRPKAEVFEIRRLLNQHRPPFMPSAGRVLDLQSTSTLTKLQTITV